MKDLRALNKYFGKYKFRFLLGIIFVICSNIFGVITPRVIRYAIDLLTNNLELFGLINNGGIQSDFYQRVTGILFVFSTVYLGLYLIKGVFTFMMRQTIIYMSRLIEYDLKNEIYAHYQRLSQAFYKRNNTGDLMNRVTEDVSRVRMYLGPAVMYTINLIVLFTLVIYSMFKVNAQLSLYVLLPLPVLSISIYYISSLINKKSEEIQRQLSKLTTIAQETFSGIRVIKSFVQEKPMMQFFDKESKNYRTTSLEFAKIQAFFFPSMMLLIGLSTILTIYIGGLQVLKGNITPGNIVEFVIYVNMLTWPVMSLGWVASLVQRAAASQKRINEFLHQQPDIISTQKQEMELNGSIAFKNVEFVYPDTGIKALTDLNLKIKKGERIAIVGKTGSGKSSIAQLLLRNYDVTKGELLIDGQNIKLLNLDSYRDQLGFVPQELFLFSDTVENNVAFGETKISSGNVQQSTKMASIHNEIETLPDGYQTMVGERGVTLSGGQKQRISIARALIRDPRILILDDSLSSVDAETEQEILGELDGFSGNRTIIIITHRIFSLLSFDQVIVLKDGEIVESGTHEELLRMNGLYFDMYEQQKLEQAVSK